MMIRVLLALALVFATAIPARAQGTLLTTVERLRATYPPKMTPAQVGELLNRVAWEHRADGWGLLRKTGGTRCPAPPQYGGDISCDILIHAPSGRHFDVLADAEGVASPAWNDKGPCVLGPSSGCAMANYLAPVPPAGAEQPPPQAPTPDPNIPRLFEQVAALTRTVEALRVWADDRFAATHEQGQVLASRATTLEHRVDLVEQRPEPEYDCDGYLNLIVFRVPTGCTIRKR